MTTNRARRHRLTPRDEGRIALLAVTLVPIVFAVQSLLDWTWFIPAPAAMALASAGYVAGRDPTWLQTSPRAEPRNRRDSAGCPRRTSSSATASAGYT